MKIPESGFRTVFWGPLMLAHFPQAPKKLKPERTYKCSRFRQVRAGRAHNSELDTLPFTVLHNRLSHHALEPK